MRPGDWASMEPIRLSSFLHCIVTRKLSIDLSRQCAVEIVSHDDVEARMILLRIAPLTWQLLQLGFGEWEISGGHLNSLFRYSPSPRRLPAIFAPDDLSLPLPRWSRCFRAKGDGPLEADCKSHFLLGRCTKAVFGDVKMFISTPRKHVNALAFTGDVTRRS
eukprot:s166_g22.t1